MNTTPLAAKILAGAISMHGWQQSDLASKAGIAAQTLSAHLNGSRPIRDDHLALYAGVLDKAEQSMLVSAWLQDTLPDIAAKNVLDAQSNTLREEVRTWRPGLNAEQLSMLDWWVAKLAADSELDHIFRAITRKAGWTADHQPTPPSPADPYAAAARHFAKQMNDAASGAPDPRTPGAPQSPPSPAPKR